MIYYKQLRPVKTIMHRRRGGGREGVISSFVRGRENRPRARVIVDSWKHEL